LEQYSKLLVRTDADLFDVFSDLHSYVRSLAF
jgi:hypothetical protein